MEILSGDEARDALDSKVESLMTHWAELWPVTPKEARTLLGSMDMDGYSAHCGGFYRHLCHAVLAADMRNREKLRRTFPGVTAAAILFQNVDGGYARLKELAEK